MVWTLTSLTAFEKWLQEMLDSQTLSIPVVCLWVVKPTDGLPLLQDWLGTAHDIVYSGYEGWREPLEVIAPTCELGKPLQQGSLVVTKGVGRASVLLFAIIFTFKELKMSECETADFARLGWVIESNFFTLLSLFFRCSKTFSAAWLNRALVWFFPLICRI